MPSRLIGIVLREVGGRARRDGAHEDEAPDSRRVASRIECSVGTSPGVTQQREALQAKGAPDHLKVLDHESAGEVQSIGPLGASAAALVEIEDCVSACKRGEIGANAFQIEPRAAVEHYEGIATAPIYPVEQAHAARSCHIPGALTRLRSVAHDPHLGVGGRAADRED